jgi:hypothetical protein
VKIPVTAHHLIRSEAFIFLLQGGRSCKKTGARLHVFHLSTKEMSLFTNKIPWKENYCRSLYSSFMVYQWMIMQLRIFKWNPAVKTANDRKTVGSIARW